MSERAIDDINDIVRGVVKLMFLPFSGILEEIFIENLPKRYAEPAEHLINARIEFLSAFRSMMDWRIERLKDVREKVKVKARAEGIKKEKVKVK